MTTKWQAIFTTTAHNGENTHRVTIEGATLQDAKLAMRAEVIADAKNGFNRVGYCLQSLTAEGSASAAEALADAHKRALRVQPC